MIFNFSSKQAPNLKSDLVDKAIQMCKDHPACVGCELLEKPLEEDGIKVKCEHTKQG